MRKLGTALLIAGVCFLFIPVILFSHYKIEDQKLEREALRIASLMEPLMPQRSQAYASDDADRLTASPKALEIEGQSYMGLLEIPSLGRSLPLLRSAFGASSKGLPYRLEGRAETKNLVLYSYGYPSLFGGLKKFPVGSQIDFVDLEGHTYSYLVTDQATTASLDAFLETLAPSGLTLVTPSLGLGGYHLIFCHPMDQE